jgi:hypothetical protein
MISAPKVLPTDEETVELHVPNPLVSPTLLSLNQPQTNLLSLPEQSFARRPGQAAQDRVARSIVNGASLLFVEGADEQEQSLAGFHDGGLLISTRCVG